jgi:hypothetical protein
MTCRPNRTAYFSTAAFCAMSIIASGCGSSGGSAAPPSTVANAPTVSTEVGAKPASTPSVPADTAAPTTVAADATTNTNASGSGARLAACTLITEQDASSALGAPAGAAVVKNVPHASQCVFGSAGALTVTEDESGKTSYDRGRAALASAPAGSWSEVSGVGDAAFTLRTGGVVYVDFYKGGTHVTIVLAEATGAVPTDAPVTLAKAAAARL